MVRSGVAASRTMQARLSHLGLASFETRAKGALLRMRGRLSS
jgi:hypothetical protein